MLKTIKNGDKVVTNSGILGTIIGIKEKSISLRSADTKLEVLKSSIAEVTERGGAAES
jgi:preprotein translocase YajC subunit